LVKTSWAAFHDPHSAFSAAISEGLRKGCTHTHTQYYQSVNTATTHNALSRCEGERERYDVSTL
jgi:hypothetical protein